MRSLAVVTRHFDLLPAVLTTALFICTNSTLVLAEGKVITQYGHDLWTGQNGLPGEAVYEVLQTADGYLWLRTSSGLVRFDGVHFVKIEPTVEGGALNETVKAIALSTDGNLLVRGTTKTLLGKDGIFSSYLTPAPLPDGDVRILHQSRDGQVWIGANDFIYLAQKNGVALVRKNTSWVLFFREDHDGNLWIGTDYALLKYSHGTLTSYSSVFSTGGALVLVEDRQGSLWVGTRIGIYRLANGKPIKDPVMSRFGNREVTAMLQDRQGYLWVGTRGSGVYRLAESRWSSFTTLDGLSDNAILSLHEDREGSIWVGTKSGLDRFRDTKFTTLTTREGLAQNETSAVLEARDGSLFIFCDAGGLTRLKDGVPTNYTARDGLAGIYGASLYEGKDGSIWIGTDKGLTRFKDNKFTNYTGNGRLVRTYISAISEDEEGLLLSTSETLVLRFNNGNLSEYTIHGQPTPLSKPGNYTFTIYRDPGGTMWFGTVKGLYKFAKGEPQANAYRPQINFPVKSIYDDQRGSLWIGGRVPGVTRYRITDGHITRYTKQDGLFDDDVTRILTDAQDNLWASTPRGIFTVGRKELDDFAEGRSRHVTSVAYGLADGMKTVEASIPEHQPAGWRTKEGKLWFTTRKGVVKIDPAHLPRNQLVPPVLMEQVVIDADALALTQNVQLAPGKKKFEFHYTALSLRVPRRVRFRYKLEGYDVDWVDPGTRRVAYYTNLPPGQYKFRVIASNDDGVWNQSGASLAFRLKPHFYQTYWFYALSVFSVLISGVGLHELRTRQMRARERHLIQIVDERTQELREHKDHLEEQVAERTAALIRSEDQLRQAQKMEAIGRLAGGVAHDFNNLLNVIVGYTELMLYELPPETPLRRNAENIRNASDKAAGLTRQLLAFARKQMVAPRVLDLNAVLREVAELLPRLVGEDIEFVVHTSREEARVRIDLVQLQQIILNLAVNARDAMPKGGSLIIRTDCVELNDEFGNQQPPCPAGQYVRLSVSDTGSGIPKEVQAHVFEPFFTTKEQGKGTGLGLATAYGIVQQAGGGISLYSEPGLGTTLRIYLPRAEEAVETVAAPEIAEESLLGRETILLVEDQDQLRALMSAFLEKLGYTVMAASRPSEALDLARQCKREIDLLLSDVVMPGMHGPELAQQICQIYPRIKTLFVSGYAPEHVFQEAMLATDFSFLEKPVGLTTLACKLREVLTAEAPSSTN